MRSRLRAPIADGGYEIVDRYRKGKGRNFVDHVRVHGDYLQVAVQESLQADYLLKWFHNIDSECRTGTVTVACMKELSGNQVGNYLVMVNG